MESRRLGFVLFAQILCTSMAAKGRVSGRSLGACPTSGSKAVRSITILHRIGNEARPYRRFL